MVPRNRLMSLATSGLEFEIDRPASAATGDPSPSPRPDEKAARRGIEAQSYHISNLSSILRALAPSFLTTSEARRNGIDHA